jgi:arabinogalactan oligomer / maltooligosaccharide transport system substrate-binding protein
MAHSRLGRCALVLTCVLALGSSCKPMADETADLTVATSWGGRSAEALNRELIRIAHELGPVRIAVRSFSATALKDYLLRSQPSRGQGHVDLVLVPNDLLGPLAERGVICELPSSHVEFLQQRLVRRALLAVSDGDRVLAYPLSAEVLALVYDPRRFPSPPRTLDEVLQAKLPAGELPLALDLLSPYYLAPLMTSFQGPLIAADGRFAWQDDAVAQVVSRLAGLWRLRGAWQTCRADDPESLQLQLFSEGKLASFITGPWLLGALEKSEHPFAVMPIPPFANATHHANGLVGYQCLAVLRESKWVDLAMDIGLRLLGDEVNERLNRSTRRLPVLLSSYKSKQAMTSRGTVGFLRALEAGQYIPPTADWSAGMQRAADHLERLRVLTKPPTGQQLVDLLRGGRP